MLRLKLEFVASGNQIQSFPLAAENIGNRHYEAVGVPYVDAVNSEKLSLSVGYPVRSNRVFTTHRFGGFGLCRQIRDGMPLNAAV